MKGRSSPDQALRRAGAMGLRPFCHGAGQRERRQASSIRQQAWAGGASCCTSPSCSGASRPGRLADAAGLVLSSCHRGDVAQLGERGVRNAEVGSSILLVSTTPFQRAGFMPALFRFGVAWGADICCARGGGAWSDYLCRHAKTLSSGCRLSWKWRPGSTCASGS